jgi:hypothetical protein
VRRVFVGRAELLAPVSEWAVLREVVRYADGDEAAKSAAINAVKTLNLGRFTGPAISHAAQRGPQAFVFQHAADALLEAVRPPAPAPPAAAVSASR